MELRLLRRDVRVAIGGKEGDIPVLTDHLPPLDEASRKYLAKLEKRERKAARRAAFKELIGNG